MKLSDYVADFLAKLGIRHVFVITGGAVAHLIDSLDRHRNIDYICMQHEQAAAMAADSYSRVTGNLGAAIATSGPGATNLITGICCAYYDSIPAIYITGQVSVSRLKRNLKVRQLGFQETEIVDICKPITKYAVLIDDAKKIRYELEKAVYIAKSGRPGPVIIDISDNIQREEIDPVKLKSYSEPKESHHQGISQNQLYKITKMISKAKRPVVIIGSGVRLSKAGALAKDFVEELKFPVALTWAMMDMLEYNHPLLIGGFGINGPRYGNFAVQNADLIISIGSRLDTHATGSPVWTFAREAKKIIVDIDKNELVKFLKYAMPVDVLIHSDAAVFLRSLLPKIDGIKRQDLLSWFNKIRQWQVKYHICPAQYCYQKGAVNPYVFLGALSKETYDGDIIISDTGNNLAQTFQGYRVSKKQRIFSAFNNTPMGYSLPASIGACFANAKKRIICITGDGGIQMNIQELAVIKKHKLPIKIFVFNNHGYGMIRQTQDDWLGSRYVASCEESGVAIPDFVKIAKAYGIKAGRINNHKGIAKKIKGILKTKEAYLCNIELMPDQKNIPMLKFGRPIEDQNPLLDRQEFLENMLIKPLEQSQC